MRLDGLRRGVAILDMLLPKWRRVRQAFEARHKARRTSPENFWREMIRADGSGQDKTLLS
jgi:hypothetical protein